ncbi:hypothetical protein MRX96_038099 [Rhipicephalus microplus]
MSSSAVSVSVSVWTLVSISMERFFAIVRPLQSRRWQTVSHAYRVIAVIWALSLIHVAPIAVLSQLIPTRTAGHQKCRELWPSDEAEKGFNLYLDSVLLVLPLLIMIFVYAIIVRTLCVGIRLENRSVALGPVAHIFDHGGGEALAEDLPFSLHVFGKPPKTTLLAKDLCAVPLLIYRMFVRILEKLLVRSHGTNDNTNSSCSGPSSPTGREETVCAETTTSTTKKGAFERSSNGVRCQALQVRGLQRRKDAGFRGSRHPHAVRGRGRVLRLLDAAVRGAHLVPVRPGRLSTTGSVRRASAWCTCWPTPRRARTPSPTASCTTSFDKGSWPRSAAAGEGNLAAVPEGSCLGRQCSVGGSTYVSGTTLLYHDTHKKVPNGRGADFV